MPKEIAMFQKKPIIAGQSYEKLLSLREENPFLNTLFFLNPWRETEKSPLKKPEMKVAFQVADSSMVFSQANNLGYNGRGYIESPDGLRATREEAFLALDENDEIIDMLYWALGDYEKYAKDIFEIVGFEKVHRLAWVVKRTWYWPASDERECATENCFDTDPRGVNLDVIIYRKPNDTSFEELVKKAEQEKHERDNAYLYPPKEMPELPGIEQALRDGHTFKAFSSGGGLRVVYIKGDDVDKGYGEHPHIEEALVHASDDYLAGGRPYKKVYGELYPHYLTGDTVSTSNIDLWIRKGSKFRCWYENNQVVLELGGYHREEFPENLVKEVQINLVTVQYTNERGYYFELSPCQFADNSMSVSRKVIAEPIDGEHRNSDMYSITKTGYGSNFWEAVVSAFESKSVEVIKTD